MSSVKVPDGRKENESLRVHPTAVRREVVKKDGEVFITMAVLCHSSRFDCDQLIEQFQRINEGIRQRMSGEASS